MGLNLSSLKYDKKLADEGVWCDVGEGAKIKVAKSGNARHRKLLNQLKRPYRHYELAQKEYPEDVLRTISVEATARTILLDWKGILGDDNKEIPFSYEAAKEALAIDGFATLVLGFANDEATFKGTSQEDMVKNSPASSSGSSKKDAVE